MRQLYVWALLIALQGCQTSDGTGTESSTPAVEGQVEGLKSEVAQLINSHRRSLGLPPLLRSASMERQIQAHMADITAGRVSFGHSGMSARCARSREELGGGNACGEIVAAGSPTALAVRDAWLGSPQHRSRIEDGRYNHTGIGLAFDEDGQAFWGMLFLEK